MPGFFSRSKAKRTVTTERVPFKWAPIGPNQIRLLKYTPESTPDDIRLQIQSFDRRACPPYAALSYMWGERTPRYNITINGGDRSVWPNLHNALRSLGNGFPEWFWIDALCIDQNNVAERNEQVREMSKTYENANFVASWIGLCNDHLRPAFDMDPRTTRMSSLSRSRQKRLQAAIEVLSESPYWKRIWVQQELLLNTNIKLFCGDYSQPLRPLIGWTQEPFQNLRLSSDIFFTLSSAVEWARWRKAPMLRLLTWAGRHECSDLRDKIFALLSLTADHERVALQRYFPDYSLDVAQVLMVTLVHIRRFSGQKRAALQLDSVLSCLGEPGDSSCAWSVRSYFYEVQRASDEPNGQGVVTLSAQQRRSLEDRRLLGGNLSILDACDCILAQELSPESTQAVDVRSPRIWQRSGRWVLDPPLSRELNRFWLVSMGEDMRDLGVHNQSSS